MKLHSTHYKECKKKTLLYFAHMASVCYNEINKL